MGSSGNISSEEDHSIASDNPCSRDPTLSPSPSSISVVSDDQNSSTTANATTSADDEIVPPEASTGSLTIEQAIAKKQLILNCMHPKLSDRKQIVYITIFDVPSVEATALLPKVNCYHHTTVHSSISAALENTWRHMGLLRKLSFFCQNGTTHEGEKEEKGKK